MIEINALLSRLHALAPSFGRAQQDIEAMISRGQSGDYKGVMQNCRLVLEAILRALVTDELKQTPGKAMLDELITKFRQQANAGLIPANVLAHMGSVQAWGNLSSHDHATRLSDESVKVGREEVIASLNSMVAILDWYVTRYGLTAPKIPATATQEVAAYGSPSIQAPALSPPPPPGPLVFPSPAPVSSTAPTIAAGGSSAPTIAAAPTLEKGSGIPVLPIVIAILATVGGVAALLARSSAPAAPYAALDTTYLRWGEPSPPPACRLPEEVPKLAAAMGNLDALAALPATRSPEAWYLLARAQLEHKDDAKAAITNALGCPDFAAALNLAGKVAVHEARLADARLSYRAALQAAPSFHNARYNLALLDLKELHFTDAIDGLKRITSADPKNADAHFMLGMAYELTKNLEASTRAYCAAAANGRVDAKEQCARGTGL